MKKEFFKVLIMIIFLGLLIYGIVWINKEDYIDDNAKEAYIIEDNNYNKK